MKKTDLKQIILYPIVLFTISLLTLTVPTRAQIKIALLKYNGGGDWYANPTSLPNLIDFCNKNLNTNISKEVATVEPGSIDIFNFPFIHMTGHGNVIFNSLEKENLRDYLLAGGFLHIDDNYGMDPYIRPQLNQLIPGCQLVELGNEHPIFRQKFTFAGGLPKIHEHDAKKPQAYGIIKDGRLLLLYTFECDLGDGWENFEVHKDPEETRIKALQMGANIIQYVFNR